ncbi:cation transporter dimerization domain-containing protein [Ktedonospora formicarum]|uniref:Cation efflux protein cytoplasmic domain-containing protein n=1 Tax=Ktedonospora formicarum TaxID=2778364 RepID=A0A8J3IG99_9CHLR|nr:cation transporter dimerization domain-containing protein [Ktedonospora formicarum]GHO50619.1 hypothetical protein KSX_87820 [Ktedonospora formicarum]
MPISIPNTVIVPGQWKVLKGHTVCEEIELAIRKALPESTVFTHLEPKEDPVSFGDIELLIERWSKQHPLWWEGRA